MKGLQKPASSQSPVESLTVKPKLVWAVGQLLILQTRLTEAHSLVIVSRMSDAPHVSPDPTRFEKAIRRFDDENARDPNFETVNGQREPRELVYARWLSEWVLRLTPEPSEALRLAARCQHICRWMIPRSDYPMTRPGYLKWRADLKAFHAKRAGEILTEFGFPTETIARVASLNLKKNLASDSECQMIEDALCLVFLQHQFSDLAAKTSEEKMINALRKSWQKMSPAGRALALQLPFADREKRLLDLALTNS